MLLRHDAIDLTPEAISAAREWFAAKGIGQLVFVSRSIPIHRLQGDFVVRLEGMLLSDVDTLLRKQRDVVVATRAD